MSTLVEAPPVWDGVSNLGHMVTALLEKVTSDHITHLTDSPSSHISVIVKDVAHKVNYIDVPHAPFRITQYGLVRKRAKRRRVEPLGHHVVCGGDDRDLVKICNTLLRCIDIEGNTCRTFGHTL